MDEEQEKPLEPVAEEQAEELIPRVGPSRSGIIVLAVLLVVVAIIAILYTIFFGYPEG